MIFTINDEAFLYEAKNIAGLFFSGVTTKVDDTAQNRLDVAITPQGERLKLAFTLTREGKETAGATSCPQVDKQTLEYNLCLALYGFLSHYTGITPPWGMMTGVRPVKIALGRLQAGESGRMVRSYLKTHFLLNDEKIDLTLKSAAIQQPFIESTNPKDFSLYISIPFCPSRCSYCSYVSQQVGRDSQLINDYLPFLLQEIKQTAAAANAQGLRLKTVYIGGGTPSTLSASQLTELCQTVNEHFTIPADGEFTCEAGRPDTITKEKLLALKHGGVDRISINPQSLSQQVLQTIGRGHSPKDILDCYHLAREVGFKSINMDLIAGLQGETSVQFSAGLEQLISLKPENITVHTLTVKRASLLTIEQGQRYTTSDREVEGMVSKARRRLEGAGYQPYYLYRQKNTIAGLENVGYSLSGYEGAYNIYIMHENHTILACGAGAATKLVNTLQKPIHRVFAPKYAPEYMSGFNAYMEKKLKGIKTLKQL